jgi:hypothetical protein
LCSHIHFTTSCVSSSPIEFAGDFDPTASCSATERALYVAEFPERMKRISARQSSISYSDIIFCRDSNVMGADLNEVQVIRSPGGIV